MVETLLGQAREAEEEGKRKVCEGKGVAERRDKRKKLCGREETKVTWRASPSDTHIHNMESNMLSLSEGCLACHHTEIFHQVAHMQKSQSPSSECWRTGWGLRVVCV